MDDSNIHWLKIRCPIKILTYILDKTLKKYDTIHTSKAVGVEVFENKIKMVAFGGYFGEIFHLLLLI